MVRVHRGVRVRRPERAVDILPWYRKGGFDLNPICPEQPPREYYLRTHGNMAEWELDLLHTTTHSAIEVYEDDRQWYVCQLCGARLVLIDREFFATHPHTIEEEPW